MAVKEDPHWPRASAWLKGEMTDEAGPEAPVLAILGVPLSQASHQPSTCHELPALVRDALARFSPFAAGIGWPHPTNVNLNRVLPVDLGDLDLGNLDNVAAQDTVARAVAELQADPRLPRRPDLLVLLGGDDSIIRPALKAHSGVLSRAGLVTLDAHHDVRVYYRNMGPHNGTPVRGLIDDGLPGSNVVQIGIGSFGNSAFYRQWAEEQGITVIGAAAARAEGVGGCVERQLRILAERCDTLFVDVDLDVLDSAYAPGSFGARPGGLASWEVHEAAFAAGRHPKVAGICIVELDPALDDASGTTVDNAALCLLQAAAGLALRQT